MNAYPLIPLVAAVLLAGCASTQPSTASRGPYVKPGLIMLTADQAEARGIKVQPASSQQPASPAPADVQPLDASSVVAPGDVKVYTMGRMVDSADRNVMHETHAVYRKESAPQWKLKAQPGQQIIVGPRVTDSRQEPQTPASQEVDSYLSDQRRVAQEDRQAIEALFRGLEALSKQQQQTQRLVLKYMEEKERERRPETGKPEAAKPEPQGGAKEQEAPAEKTEKQGTAN